jgi:hypothetical protein
MSLPPYPDSDAKADAVALQINRPPRRLPPHHADTTSPETSPSDAAASVEDAPSASSQPEATDQTEPPVIAGSTSGSSPRAGDRRRGLGQQWLLISVCFLVLVPVVSSIIQHGTGGWVPDGDDAWVARRTMQVVSSSPPLIGQESTASDEPTESGLSHLGPASYYVMAGPYALAGWSPIGITIGASLVVASAILAAVWLASRVAGDRGTVAAGIVIAALAIRLGQEWLVRPTSSVLAVMPLFAAIVGLWAYLRRDRMGFVVAIAFGSFAIQTSLVVLPLASVVVLAALTVAAIRLGRSRELPWVGWSWIVLVLVAASWIPPLIDQFTRSPGNLADLLQYLYSDTSGASRRGKVTEALGIGPALATVIDAVTNPWCLGGRQLRGGGVWLLETGQLGLVAPGIFAMALAASTWWAVRRQRTVILVLLGVAVALTAAAVVAFSRRPTATLFNSTYFVLWIQAVAATWWLAIVLCGVDAAVVAARRRQARAPRRAKGRKDTGMRPALVYRAGLGLIAVLVIIAAAQPIPRDEADRVRTLSEQVRANLPDGTYEVEGKGLVAWVSTAKGLGTDLLAHGYDIRFTEWGGMVDEQARRAEPRMAQVFVVAQEGGQITDIDRSDPSLLGSFEGDGIQILVWYVPGGDYASLCEQVAIARSSYVPGPLIDGDVVASPDRVADLLGGIDLDQLARDAGDRAHLDAVALLQAQRAPALAALEAVEPGSPVADLQIDPTVLGAIGTVFATYQRECLVAPGPT